MVSMPRVPSRSACQKALIPMPTGVTAPSPVMTTRLLTPVGSESSGALLVGESLHEGHDVGHRRQLGHLLVADLDLELALGGDGQLDGVERVHAQLVDEVGVG